MRRKLLCILTIFMLLLCACHKEETQPVLSTVLESTSLIVEKTTAVSEKTTILEIVIPSTEVAPEKTTVVVPEKTTVVVPEKTTVVVPEKTTVVVPEKTTVVVPEKTTVVVPEKTTVAAETTAPNPEDPVISPKDDNIYIFVANSFMGSYKDGIWQSVTDTKVNYAQPGTAFYLKDILNQANYFGYDYKGLVNTADKIIMNIGDGLGGFTAAEIQLLLPYGISNADNFDASTRIFELPFVLDETASKIKIPIYNFSVYAPDSNVESPAMFPNAVLTNVSHNLVPWQIVNYTDGHGYEEFMKIYLMGLGMPDAAVNISNIYEGDFDNDGKKETLLLANSEDEYELWQEYEKTGAEKMTGSYAIMLLLREDGSVEELCKKYYPFVLKDGFDWTLHYYQVLCEGVYDFTADGIAEIPVEYAGWEWGNNRLLARSANGLYETVLKSEWGL